MMLASLQSGEEKAKEKSELCRKNYVNAKDCDKWVADQLARRAARRADEQRRRKERRADEEARKAARKAHEERRRQGQHAHEAGAPRDTQHKVARARAAPAAAAPAAKDQTQAGDSEGATGSPADRIQAAFLASAPTTDSMGGFVLPATGGAFLAAAVSLLASVMIVRLRTVQIGERPLLG